MAFANAANSKLIGYYPDWGKWMTPSYTVDKVPYEKLTHVLWSFVSPDSDASLRGDAIENSSDLDSMVSLAHKVGTKVILSLGGAGLCENFAAISKNDSMRALFIHNLILFVKEKNLDGLDLDWEYSSVPVPVEDSAAYTKLVLDLRDSLDQSKSLSAALPCSPYYGKFFSVEGFIDKLDWLGLMTYDITGSWDDLARFNSPLFPNPPNTTWSWSETADYWGSRNVESSKMIFGVASFGFDFGKATGPASSFDKNDVKYASYASIRSDDSWTIHFDDVAKVPYGISEDRYVTFDDPMSVAIKARYVIENNYAGIMVWELSLDYTEGESQPIVDSLSSVLLKGSSAISYSDLQKNSFLRYEKRHLYYIGKESVMNVQIKNVNGKTIIDKMLKSGESINLSGFPFGRYIAVTKYGVKFFNIR